MTEIAKALYAFYSSFGIPAYTENSVPAEEKLLYITYTLPQSELFSAAVHQVRVWYYGTNNEAVNAKAGEIVSAIGRGIKLRAGDGLVCIYPGAGALVQMQPSEETVRIAYINLQIRSYV